MFVLSAGKRCHGNNATTNHRRRLPPAIALALLRHRRSRGDSALAGGDSALAGGARGPAPPSEPRADDSSASSQHRSLSHGTDADQDFQLGDYDGIPICTIRLKHVHDE